LTPSLLPSATGHPLTHHNIFDPPYRFGKAGTDEVGALRELFTISAVDVHGPATGPATRFHITPPVPHHDTSAQVQSEVDSSGSEQAGRGLPAPTTIGVVVETYIQPVEQDLSTQLAMNGVDDLSIEHAAGDVGLVGDNH
jgi:hypothetical protein